MNSKEERVHFNLWHVSVLCILIIIAVGISTSNGYSQSSIAREKLISPKSDAVTRSTQEIPEEYVRPELFSEGKTWVVWHGLLFLDDDDKFDYNDIEPNYLFYVSVDGEETIDGVLCKRLKFQTQYLGGQCWDCRIYSKDKPDIKYFYFYEDGDKIYLYREPITYYKYDENGEFTGEIDRRDPYFDLYMDLDISVGDNLIDIGIVDKIEFRDIGGKTRRVVSSYWPEFDLLGYERNWIDGIGSNCCANKCAFYHDSMTRPSNMTRGSFDTTLFWHESYYLVMCCENGIPIYDNRENMQAHGVDLSMLSAEISEVREIQSYQPSQIEDSKIYNLQGLEVSTPQKGQIYICGGKKIIF